MAKTERVSSTLSQQKLMDAIAEAIRKHTLTTPMGIDEIVSVMGFTTGCAIGQGDNRRDRRLLKEMAIANIDHGLDTISGKVGGLILN